MPLFSVIRLFFIGPISHPPTAELAALHERREVLSEALKARPRLVDRGRIFKDCMDGRSAALSDEGQRRARAAELPTKQRIASVHGS